MIKGLLCDIDGVLYEGNEVLHGSVEAIKNLRKAGVKVRFLTNTTTRPVNQIVEKLNRFGFQVDDEEVISPLQLAINRLAEEGDPSVFLVTRQSVYTVFEAYAKDNSSPDFVIVGDIGDHWDYKLMNEIFLMVRKGAKIIALHKNRFGVTGGEVSLDIGGFVAAIEYATNTESLVLGKPSYDFFDRAVKTMGLLKDQVLMVGDDLDADVGGAKQYGIRAALVKSGKYTEAYYQKASIKPDYLVDSLCDLVNQFE